MALQKQIAVKGVTANYWKIISTNQNMLTNKTSVTVGLYVSKPIRDESVKNILQYQTLQIPGIDLTRPQIYDLLVTLPAFKGAVSC